MHAFPQAGRRATSEAVLRVLPLLLAGAALSPAAPAWASGGSHNVDDSEVEAAGRCHLEVWGTRLGERAGLINFGPGCTPKRWPRLELGGFVQPSASTGASAAGSAGPAVAADGGGVAPLFGPAVKYTFRHDDTGLGVGATGGLTYDGAAGRVEAVSGFVPLTWQVRPGVRVNLNAGAQYIRSDRELESFFGAQLEIALGRGFTLMAEHFGRSRAFAGDQLGLRWTPKSDRYDVDLVLGRRIDGASGFAFTLGVTARR